MAIALLITFLFIVFVNTGLLQTLTRCIRWEKSRVGYVSLRFVLNRFRPWPAEPRRYGR